MSRKATIKDIAARLQVSTTTVYKAMHGKDKIGEETRRKILEVARELNYTPNRFAQALARKPVRIAIVCPDGPLEFQGEVIRGMEDALLNLADYNVTGDFYYYKPSFSSAEVVRHLEQLESRYGGVLLESGFYGDPAHRKAVNHLSEEGVPVLTLMGDLPDSKRIGYIKSNGLVMGKLAAEFLFTKLGSAGSAAVLTPQKGIEIHDKCVEGFLSVAKSTGLSVTGVFETGVDGENISPVIQRLAAEFPGCRGIYTCSYNAPFCCRFLKELGLAGRIAVVGQDLYSETVQCLRQGEISALLFQNQYQQGYEAVSRLADYLSRGDVSFKSKLFTPELVLNANLECYYPEKV